MSFINQHSFRCLLGPQSRNVEIHDDVYSWHVGKKRHFSTGHALTPESIQQLKEFGSSNFHYLDQSNVDELKRHFKVKKVKNKSIVIDLENFSLNGGKMRNVRHAVNSCSRHDFEILDNYRNINDVKALIDEWSSLYTDKYFRDFSGKNLFFYKNNFHLDCFNVFIYSEERLVAFGTLSPAVNGQSSYIIGKALYKRFYGLSEYADILLYMKAVASGIKLINMGQASKGLLFYKTKFPHYEEEHYDGSIEV